MRHSHWCRPVPRSLSLSRSLSSCFSSLCIVPELKEAASSNISNRSSPHSSSSSCQLLVHSPHLGCSRTLATDVNMHDLGVCSPPNGRTIASMIAMLTTSWYLLNSSPEILFNLVSAENPNRLHHTTNGI